MATRRVLTHSWGGLFMVLICRANSVNIEGCTGKCVRSNTILGMSNVG
jgi:hypothetical protein